MRRTTTHARDRVVSKKRVSPSHHDSGRDRSASQPLGRTRGIALDEVESALDLRQRGHAGPDAQHRPKPQVLADTLVHHLLVHAAAPSVRGMRTNRQILVAEHAPDTEHLQALRFVRLHEESVSHGVIALRARAGRASGAARSLSTELALRAVVGRGRRGLRTSFRGVVSGTPGVTHDGERAPSAPESTPTARSRYPSFRLSARLHCRSPRVLVRFARARKCGIVDGVVGSVRSDRALPVR